MNWAENVTRWFLGEAALPSSGHQTVSEGPSFERLCDRLGYHATGYAGTDIANTMSLLLDRIEAAERKLTTPPPPTPPPPSAPSSTSTSNQRS